MKITMMLADHSQVADGKLFISGGGWTTCAPGPVPCAVAAIFQVPWQETGRKIEFTLRLIDEDGKPVVLPGSADGLPVGVNGSFEARRPADFAPGQEVNVPMSFNVTLHLDPGVRYSWVVEVDGETEDDWQVTFETRK